MIFYFIVITILFSVTGLAKDVGTFVCKPERSVVISAEGSSNTVLLDSKQQKENEMQLTCAVSDKEKTQCNLLTRKNKKLQLSKSNDYFIAFDGSVTTKIDLGKEALPFYETISIGLAQISHYGFCKLKQ